MSSKGLSKAFRSSTMSCGISGHVSLFLLLLTASTALAEKARVLDLNEETWKNMLHSEWMVAFVAPWCPACKNMHSAWWEFGDWSDSLGVTVAQVDITENPGLSGRFMVTALPTIYHVKDGVFRQYYGARDRDSFMNFVEQKKWTQIKPISAWKDPNSLQMSVVAKFFQWSYQIRAIHTYLVDRGIPYWASYGLFALSTIVIGAVLGLIIVACIDYVFPGKSLDHQRVDESPAQDGSDLEEDQPDEAHGDHNDTKDAGSSKEKKKEAKKID